MSPSACRHPALARSLRFLERNWHRPINVTDLVTVSGLSRRGFIKAFRKHTGNPPGRWLRRLRLVHAQRLLVQTDKPVATVAARCGYRSANSFVIAFRHFSGCPPNHFRNSSRVHSLHWLKLQLQNPDAEFPRRFAQTPEQYPIRP